MLPTRESLTADAAVYSSSIFLPMPPTRERGNNSTTLTPMPLWSRRCGWPGCCCFGIVPCRHNGWVIRENGHSSQGVVVLAATTPNHFVDSMATHGWWYRPPCPGVVFSPQRTLPKREAPRNMARSVGPHTMGPLGGRNTSPTNHSLRVWAGVRFVSASRVFCYLFLGISAVRWGPSWA